MENVIIKNYSCVLDYALRKKKMNSGPINHEYRDEFLNNYEDSQTLAYLEGEINNRNLIDDIKEKCIANQIINDQRVLRIENLPQKWVPELEFTEYKEEIEISKSILEDSKISLEIFKIASKFLYELILAFYNQFHKNFDIPSIQQGIEGDIDLVWNNKKFDLLLSISGNSNEKSGLFGNSKIYDDTIKLEFDYTEIKEELLKWLVNHY
jgi:hypothetical protein